MASGLLQSLFTTRHYAWSTLRRLQLRVYSSSSYSTPAIELRHLMRYLAHPVTIITVNSPNHGSTISSFTSISLSPFPLISFAVKLPSRLATHLSSSSQTSFKVHLLDSSPKSMQLAQTFASPKGVIDEKVFKSLEKSCLGKLECELFRTVKLVDDDEQSHIGSVLFLGKVIKGLKTVTEEGEERGPLLYHQQRYTSIK
ncbi:hypothetical protein CROQUDRAFT_654773 [Cronartium quercuum f. sp. fusiforme G11]|uniref:Flavin reductase like domain-containing protein n=1 Tax=Cronartium quercuum f. sp. fusiforme G11 TaxID=708437 RepID=A0A9P6NM15_9BASI|nr:hypothetical protein CROQUDRAFT_654773 [Cronartium quercuum f. sp. fusiforme G11]